jgi:hypothetical protein
LAIFFIVLTVSPHIPGLPAFAGLKLMRLGAAGKGATVPNWIAVKVLCDANWYEGAILPAFAGMLDGFLIGLFRRLGAYETLVAGGTMAVFLLLMQHISIDLESVLGIVLFLFCLSGGIHLVADLRRLRPR